MIKLYYIRENGKILSKIYDNEKLIKKTYSMNSAIKFVYNYCEKLKIDFDENVEIYNENKKIR